MRKTCAVEMKMLQLVCSHKLAVFKLLLQLFFPCSTLLALLEEVTADEENWARMLYHLRHTLWPNGVLDLSPWQPLSYPEKRQLRQQALTEIKNFLPGLLIGTVTIVMLASNYVYCVVFLADVFPYLVGSENYTAVLQHGLDSLENPTLNRLLQ